MFFSVVVYSDGIARNEQKTGPKEKSQFLLKFDAFSYFFKFICKRLDESVRRRLF